jgi:hypothetical protein
MNPNDNSQSPALTLVLLVSLLLFCGSFGLFMLQQASIMNSQVVQARRIIAEYENNGLPRLTTFVSQLQAFAQRNPDFAPILAKYGMQPGSPQGLLPAAPKK